MEYLSFDSPDEMRQYLARANSEANRRLHPMQRNLTFGDCWVQFYDIEEKHFIFGRIHTLDEVHAAEIASGQMKADAVDACRVTEGELLHGLMYGEAFDRIITEPVLGITHKMNAWPLDKSVYAEALEAKGDIDAMPLWARISLSIALSGWRSHMKAYK